MLAVLEEGGVLRRLVVAGHAQAHAGLQAQRDRAHQLLPARARALGRGQRDRHDRGAGVQHRGQVGVVVVEGVGEHAVDERRQPGRQPLGHAHGRGRGVAALAARPGAGRAAGLQRGRGHRDADGVEHALAHAVDHGLGQGVEGRGLGEGAELLGQGRVAHEAAPLWSLGLGLGVAGAQGEGAHRGAGGAEDVHRHEDERELRPPGRGQALEVERLDDVDARLDQQHPVGRQQRVAAARREPLEGDGVGARGVHPALGQPHGAGLPDPRHARGAPDVRRALGEARAPAAADQHDVARADGDAGALGGGLEVGDGDLVAALAVGEAEVARDVEQHAAAQHRRDGVHAVLLVLAADAGRGRVGAAVELAVEGDVGQRVDVGADVGAGGDHVVGGAAAVGAHHVAVAARQGVPELRVVGRLRHAHAQLAAQVDRLDPGLHGAEQVVGAGDRRGDRRGRGAGSGGVGGGVRGGRRGVAHRTASSSLSRVMASAS